MEIYKDIPGYERIYQVSNFGNVKRLDRIVITKTNITRRIKERYLSQHEVKGYKLVWLYKEGFKKGLSVHQLVAITFLNHKPSGHILVVDHIDNNQANNHVDNLQIITHRRNLSKDKKGYSSEYIGVSWDGSRGKWYACIQIGGKTVSLGRYDKERDAMLAYETRLMELKQE